MRQYRVPESLRRRARSKYAELRPKCPTCGERMPGQDENREHWLEKWGHRDARGEPCIGAVGRWSEYIERPKPMVTRGRQMQLFDLFEVAE